MQQLNFKYIIKTYPDFYNWELPLRARCARTENIENARRAFLKYCPKMFVINDLEPTISFFTSMHPRRVWRVEYRLKDGENLPPSDDPSLTMYKLLTTYTPEDTLMLERESTPPNSAVILYGIICKCNLCQLDVATRLPTWPIDKHENDIIVLEDLNLN